MTGNRIDWLIILLWTLTGLAIGLGACGYWAPIG